jgi:flagellar hook assembly protein FlgD
MSLPNPMRGGTLLIYDLEEETQVAVDLVDVAGRRVTVLLAERQSAGRHEIHWDGNRADGTSAPPGVYFARFHFGDEVETRSIVKVE